LVDFGTLALIGACGLAGPFLASAAGGSIPVVVGEILAGVLVGTSGIGAIDPTQPTLAFLSDIGFAMLMFSVGMSVPVRDERLRAALGRGGAAAIVVGLAAAPAGILAARISGPDHAALYAVILASSSAAIALPILEERRLEGRNVLIVMAQVTIADVVAILAVPFALEPSKAGSVIVGTLLIIASTIAFFGVMRLLRRTEWFHEMRRQSKLRRWALDLRIPLMVLFFLAWLAKGTGSSILIAGFGSGLVVAIIGGPKRLSTEVLGIGQGFFIPLFFVLLGARLDIRALVSDPSVLALAGALIGLNLAIHAGGALITRQRLGAGMVAAAQMGVPAAVVTLGLSQHILDPGEGAAIMAAAMISLGACAIGAVAMERAKRGHPSSDRRPA
jgi:Kef-type K+ transport system membrane component KefB